MIFPCWTELFWVKYEGKPTFLSVFCCNWQKQAYLLIRPENAFKRIKTLLTFKKSLGTLTRKPPIQQLNGSSVFGWGRFSLPKQGRVGSMPPGVSLLPPTSSPTCQLLLKETGSEGPERRSPLTGTIRLSLTLGACWVLKLFVSRRQSLVVSLGCPTVSLPLQCLCC